MESFQSKIYFSVGRFLFGFVMIYMAVESFALCGELGKEVPFYINFGKFWVIIMGIIYSLAAFSFLSNKGTGFMAFLITLMTIIILFSSTLRGFETGGNYPGTILKFASHLAIIGCALMIASEGALKKSYDTGRVLVGIFFMCAGILHLTHISQDATMLSSFENAKGLVIFTGICWILCALSLWSNILSRFAALGGILLVLIITFVINTKGGVSSWGAVSQLFVNLSLISGCFLIAAGGNWFNFRGDIFKTRQAVKF